MKSWEIEFRQALAGHFDDREIGSLWRLVFETVTRRDWVYFHLDQELGLSPGVEERIREIIQRLLNREPIQYILGETTFYGLKLKVGPGVLIPRGETEELVEWILKAEGERRKAKEIEQEERLKIEDGGSLKILDIGCGSGAIAVALAKNLPEAEVFAADISDQALRFTSENAELNKVEITVFNLDILNPNTHSSSFIPDPSLSPFAFHHSPFDIIVSNPPYIPYSEKGQMNRNVADHEPAVALFAPDDDPLLYYRAIAGFAKEKLKPSGRIYVEIHHPLAAQTVDLFNQFFNDVELRQDIHGRNRMIRATNG